MPELYRPVGGKWKVTMYFMDHNPPHFHIVCKDGEALVRIDTLDVIAGAVPSKMLKTALVWAAENKSTLRTEWDQLHK